MSDSKELVPAAELPSDRAIVRRYQHVIAESPMDIKPGQAVFLDKRGGAFGRGRFERRVLALRLLMFGGMIGGVALTTLGALLPGVMLYALGTSPLLWTRYYGHEKLIAIDVLLRQGHLDEAQRRLEAASKLRRRSPVTYAWLSGNLSSHRGDYAAAIRWWSEALPRTDGIFREIVKSSIVRAQLLDGRIVEAQRAYDDVRFPPEADDVLTQQVLTRLMMALHDASPALSTEELHDCASRLLAYSHTGVDLAALGLAFERAGDDDMAQMLATEALDRMHYQSLATWWPALQRWLDQRTAATPAKSDPHS